VGTPRVHHAARRGGVAARGARAAEPQTNRLSWHLLLALERHLVDAFVQSLRELGHVDGENIAIEYRWAEGQDNRLPNLAAELVRLGPDVLVTTGTPGTIAAKQATSTIPIVFASSGNPITAGLVASLARPGGNVTGFTLSGAELEGKRVQLLKEAVPGLSRLAVVWNPANPPVFEFYQLTKAAAAALGLTLQPVVEVRQSMISTMPSRPSLVRSPMR
jgi:putative tryptophan/tyrosine transport system substrate-binding protein